MYSSRCDCDGRFVSIGDELGRGTNSTIVFVVPMNCADHARMHDSGRTSNALTILESW